MYTLKTEERERDAVVVGREGALTFGDSEHVIVERVLGTSTMVSVFRAKTSYNFDRTSLQVSSFDRIGILYIVGLVEKACRFFAGKADTSIFG